MFASNPSGSLPLSLKTLTDSAFSKLCASVKVTVLPVMLLIPAVLFATVNFFSALNVEFGITTRDLYSTEVPPDGIRTCRFSEVLAPIRYPSRTFSGGESIFF